MSTLLVERFANQLSTEDIRELFGKLQVLVANRKKAAQQCGLERKTTYDWGKMMEMRLETKRKVLSALLENLPEDTLEFMTQKSVESSSEILRIYLGFLYEEILDSKTDATRFHTLLSKFIDVRRRYSGLAIDHLSGNIADMLRFIDRKASELGLQESVPPMELARFDRIAGILSPLAKVLSSEPLAAELSDTAKKFNVPLEFVQSLSSAFSEYFDEKRELYKPICLREGTPGEPWARLSQSLAQIFTFHIRTADTGATTESGSKEFELISQPYKDRRVIQNVTPST